MFCFQCEQTSKGEGCTKIGVCGKQPDVAALQDLLIYAVKGLSQVAVEGRKVGINDNKLDHFACEAIFSTLTNVDFDSNRFVRLINETVRLRDDLKEKVTVAGGKVDFAKGPATFIPESTKEALVNQGGQVGVKSDPAMDQDILSLRELLIYGLKGLAAYADHAAILGREDDTVYAFVHEAMAATLDKGLSVEDYIEAVKNKAIRHFFLVGGCDGAKPGRDYYTRFVEQVPDDCVVLTLACGKFRFFDKDLGDIGGIPRLLDIGQCNDAYSAIQIAVALADAFNCGVNDLPLSMILSWYEQKACAILLTLLYLGVKNIRLGPSLPAFVSPNVLNVLVEKFNIMPIKTPEEDLKAILG